MLSENTQMKEKLMLSKVLRKNLENKNLAAVGKAVGLDRRILHSWIYQDRIPSLKFAFQLQALADYLNLRLEELLFDSSDKNAIASFTFKDEGSVYKVLVEKINY